MDAHPWENEICSNRAESRGSVLCAAWVEHAQLPELHRTKEPWSRSCLWMILLLWNPDMRVQGRAGNRRQRSITPASSWETGEGIPQTEVATFYCCTVKARSSSRNSFQSLQCNLIVDSHHVIRQLIKMTFCILCWQPSVPGAVGLNDNICIRVRFVTDICKSQRGARKSDPCMAVLAEMF